MPLAFLAPVFLAGLALVIVPWILHRIRRPEREPVRFPSLMFVPVVQREVVERRRLQHLLLMLLRMLALAVLALAFARLVQRAPASLATGGERVLRVVAIDVSGSMTARSDGSTAFERARRRALQIVDSMGPDERVAVIAYDEAPRAVAPLGIPADGSDTDATTVSEAEFEEDDLAGAELPAGSPERARAAIAALSPGERATRHVPALRLAQDLLMPGAANDGEEPPRRILHLITDFQRSGLPPEGAGWRLSPRVELAPENVGDAIENLAASGLALRALDGGRVRVSAQIRNASNVERRARARLALGEETIEEREVALGPEAAGRVGFEFDPKGRVALEGRVEVTPADGIPDDLALDDARLFAWSAPRRKEALILADDLDSGNWPGRMFLERAFPASDEAAWRTGRVDQAGLARALGERIAPPDAIVVGELDAMTAETASAIEAYVRSGGGLLLSLDPTRLSAASNAVGTPLEGLLSRLGLRLEGPAHDRPRAGRFATLAWIDFSHPVFAPFQGARYNDFSTIRFMNRALLSRVGPDDGRAGDPTGEGARVLARFESESDAPGRPAIVESRLGAGGAIIWAFGLDPQASNLARNVKFVPLLHETLARLTGREERRETWFVGEIHDGRPPATSGASGWRVQMPGREERALAQGAPLSEAQRLLTSAGFVRWRPEGEGAPFAHVEAVNPRPEESDPRRVPPEEFVLRFAGSAPPPPPDALDPAAARVREKNQVVKREFWRPLLVVLLLGLVLEGWYAARLPR